MKEAILKFQSNKNETEIKEWLKTQEVVTNFPLRLDANADGEPKLKCYNNCKIFATRVPTFISSPPNNETEIKLSYWVSLAKEMPTTLKKMKTTRNEDEEAEFQRVIGEIVPFFYTFLESVWSQIKKMGVNNTTQYTINWGNKTKKGTYRRCLELLVACALATIRYATQDSAGTITRSELRWPGPIKSIVQKKEELELEKDIDSKIAKIDLALQKSNSTDISTRQTGLLECKSILKDLWSDIEENVRNTVTAAKYELAMSANNKICKTLMQKFKDTTIETVEIYLDELFQQKLRKDDKNGILAYANRVNEFKLNLEKDNNSIDTTKFQPLIHLLSQVSNYCIEERTVNIDQAFKEMNLEESREYVMGVTKNTHPPQIKLDTRDAFDPPVWRGTKDLGKFIYEDYLHYCAKHRVTHKSDMIRGIYYIFQKQSQRNDFGREVLKNLPEGSTLDDIAIDRWIKKISQIYDVNSGKTSQDYLQQFFDNEKMRQKRNGRCLDMKHQGPVGQNLNQHWAKSSLSIWHFPLSCYHRNDSFLIKWTHFFRTIKIRRQFKLGFCLSRF